MPDCTFILLVRRFIDGNREAFTRIYNQCRSQVCSFIYSIIKDLGVAEDLTQETLFRAYSRRQELKNPESFLSWLMQIAKNLALNYLKRGHGLRDLLNPTQRDFLNIDELVDSIPDEYERSFEQVLDLEEDLEELESLVIEVLGNLPQKYRRIIILRYYESLSHSEIADILNCSKGAAKLRLHRAMQKLKRESLKKLRTLDLDTYDV